jgi:hypothetical protein
MTRLMPLVGKDPTKWGRNGDINLKELAEVDFPIHVRLDVRPVAEFKMKAGAEHVSQGGVGMRSGLMGLISRFVGEREDFMRAYPPAPNGHYKVANDLFAPLKVRDL